MTATTAATMSTDEAGSTHAGEPPSSTELDTEKSKATRIEEEMAADAPQPVAKRKVEPKNPEEGTRGLRWERSGKLRIAEYFRPFRGIARGRAHYIVQIDVFSTDKFSHGCEKLGLLSG